MQRADCRSSRVQDLRALAAVAVAAYAVAYYNKRAHDAVIGMEGEQVTEAKISMPDGTQLDAQFDTLPRAGDRLLISDNMGSPEKSYSVQQVDFHLSGPMTYTVSSITIGVA